MHETETAAHGGEKSSVRTLGRPATLLFGLLIIAGAALLVYIIYSSEPKAERETAIRETAMLVDVIPAERGTFVPQVSGLGTVTAAQDIELSPRVSGRVIEISDSFLPGGFARKGETLLKLDPADYEYALKQQESLLKQAESDWALELGRRDVAERDYELLGRNLKDQNLALALREPQLEAARAAMMSAQAAHDQAKLDLARTTVTAPFNAQVLTREANIGSEVGPGTVLARLVGIDEYHVIVTVPLAKLRQVVVPTRGEKGSPVTIRDRAAWPSGVSRQGEIRSLIGAIDMETRLARLLVSVKDPLSLDENRDAPALIVGSVVQAHINGRPLEDVVRLNRDYLRQADTVWVMEDGVLKIREVAVAFRDTDYAYIRDGLNAGDRIVTGSLATVVEGVSLRTEGDVNDPAR